jgi:hypothetical protein
MAGWVRLSDAGELWLLRRLVGFDEAQVQESADWQDNGGTA